MSNRFSIAILSCSLFAAWATGQDGDPFQYDWTEPSPGVWVGVRKEMGRHPVMGTTTFVVGEEGVIVFDGGGVALMSERTIAKIRELTDLPVTHVIISHWHGDHNFGIYRFREQFPNVQFVAHEFTYAAMTGAPLEYIHRRPEVPARLREMAAEQLADPELDDYGRGGWERLLEDLPLVAEEYDRVKLTLPTLSFQDALTIHSGSRAVQVLFLGVGNTAGDIVLWLEDERIVASGDLVVYPTPYGFNVPPRGWAATLERLKQLDYSYLVPGHGDILQGTEYVDLLIECSLAIADQADALVAAGVAQEEAEQQLDFSDFADRFIRGDRDNELTYMEYFEKPLRKAVFKEMTGAPMVRTEKPNDG